ncbi:Uncharacterised protein [Catenibacterium mitsuokai]|nr:Uncharacterised protein [Catenibacterium mitsuokai]
MYTLSRKSDELTDYFINQYFLKWTLLNGHYRKVDLFCKVEPLLRTLNKKALN